VWLAIEDPVAHARWHPFVTEIIGTHELEQVRKRLVLSGKKPGHTRERCVEHEPGHHVVWQIEQDTTGFARMVSAWRASSARRISTRAPSYRLPAGGRRQRARYLREMTAASQSTGLPRRVTTYQVPPNSSTP
jgi:hypothetical protein